MGALLRRQFKTARHMALTVGRPPYLIPVVGMKSSPENTGVLRDDFPRTIWMLWYQGWENAPELVKRCLCSWQHHNRGWTIRLNWRLDPADIVPGTFVHYLFAMIPYKSCENHSEVSTGLTTDSGHEHDQS